MLTQDWPVRIAVRGVDSTQSSIGGVIGEGADGFVTDPETYVITPPQAGPSVTIVSNATVNIGNITSVGGDIGEYCFGNAGDSGNVTLTDCVAGNIVCSAIQQTCGDGNANGGDVLLTNSTVGNITSNGASSYGENYGQAGDVTLVGCNAGNITCGYSDGSYHGNGGDVTVTGSVCGHIVSAGGSGVSSFVRGGDIAVTNSTCLSISTSGGGNDFETGGFGGDIVIVGSTTGTVGSGGGYSGGGFPAAAGGNITITDSSTGNISTAAGVIWTNSESGPSSTTGGGTITLVGSTRLPNSVTGLLLTSTLNKGRGVNGSNILGLV